MTEGKGGPAEVALTGEVQDVAHVLTLGAHSFPCADHMPIGTMIRLSTQEVSSFELYHHMLVKVVSGPKVQVGEDRISGRPIMEPAAMGAVWDACDELEPEDVLKAIQALFDSYTAPTPTEPESSSPSGQAAPADR